MTFDKQSNGRRRTVVESKSNNHLCSLFLTHAALIHLSAERNIASYYGRPFSVKAKASYSLALLYSFFWNKVFWHWWIDILDILSQDTAIARNLELL